MGGGEGSLGLLLEELEKLIREGGLGYGFRWGWVYF